MISIVIPFIGADEFYKMTHDVIWNIRETAVEEQEIIIVQQTGHRDDLLDKLVEKYIYWPEIPPDVRSFGALYNRGFDHAHGDVLINMHNDVELPKGWDVDLAAAAREGLIGCVFADDSESDCESRGVEKAGNNFIPSCCFSVSRKTWDALGGYDERFTGFHWEDNDLFLRAAEAGGGPVRCDVTVKHHRGNTRSKNIEYSNFCMVRNKEKYYQKHYELFKDSGIYILNLPDTANYRRQGGKENERHIEAHGIYGSGQAVAG